MSDKVIFTFNPKQDGEFISGIPARDLTEADLLNLSPIELRDIVGVAPGAHRYYEPVTDNKDLPAHLHLAEPEVQTTREMTRKEMDAAAADLGIEHPESFKTKADLKAAIEAAQSAAAAQEVDVPIVEDTGDGLAVTGTDAQTVDEAHEG